MYAASRKKNISDVCDIPPPLGNQRNGAGIGFREPAADSERHQQRENEAKCPMHDCSPALCDFLNDMPRFAQYARPQVNDNENKAGEKNP